MDNHARGNNRVLNATKKISAAWSCTLIVVASGFREFSSPEGWRLMSKLAALPFSPRSTCSPPAYNRFPDQPLFDHLHRNPPTPSRRRAKRALDADTKVNITPFKASRTWQCAPRGCGEGGGCLQPVQHSLTWRSLPTC